MASNKSSRLLHPSLLTSLLFLIASTAFGDEIQTSGVPTSGLLCISECGSCPTICSPPPSPPESSKVPPPSPPESGKLPPLMPTPLPPTPPVSTPSTPLLLPPEAPIVEFSPPPSYHSHSPPTSPPSPPKAPPSSSSSPLVTNPKSAQSPPDIPYVIVPGGPTPPLGQGNNYPYPYYYYYSNGASLSIPLTEICFSVLLLIHGFCFCS